MFQGILFQEIDPSELFYQKTRKGDPNEMKKVFALILALCLIAALLPMAVMAEETETTTPTEATAPESVKVYIRFGATITLTLKSGEVAYVTSGEDKTATKWTDKENAPADNFLKLEYTAEEPATLKATFSNFHAESTASAYTSHGVEFTSGEYAVAVELIGENSMFQLKSACIKYNNAGGMTITGAGSLAMNMGTSEESGAASGTLWANGGDLLIKDTTMNFTIYSSKSSKHHAILSTKGNVTIEGCTINMQACGGQLAYTGLATDKNPRYTLDEDASRIITIKDSTVTGSGKAQLLQSTAPAVLDNSSITFTTTTSEGIFYPQTPTLVGDYTAMGGAKESSAKDYELDAKKLWSSSKYIKLTPGKSSGSSSSGTTTTDPSNKPTGDNFNIVLVSALALVSAVSVAGVTFVGKKRV